MTDILNCLRECSQALNGHADVNHTADDDEAAADVTDISSSENRTKPETNGTQSHAG